MTLAVERDVKQQINKSIYDNLCTDEGDVSYCQKGFNFIFSKKSYRFTFILNMNILFYCIVIQ